jgi:hypothetical protein
MMSDLSKKTVRVSASASQRRALMLVGTLTEATNIRR